MRLPAVLLAVVLLTACDAIEDDLPGKLVQVEVRTQFTDCTPPRFTGDAGRQFFGERQDGGLVFTMAEQAQYGPTHDGGTLESVQRQLVPSTGRAIVGEGNGCEGAFSLWERTTTGLRLIQEWPGADTCPTGPLWLPQKACTSTRLYFFTDLGTCQLRCVRISSRGEIDCKC